MPTATRNATISDDLRSAIADTLRERNISVRELGRLADVDDGVIARFVARERGLTIATLDRLGPVLGVRLVRERARGRSTATRTRAGA